MPVGYTSQRDVQISGFDDSALPLSASCSSGQHFASSLLQIRSRPRHPCRVCRRLSPPSRQAHHHSGPDSAMPGAP
ncbi:hypothetical protein DNK08_13095 [Stutzerimonas kirkiae]|nr:hypothetical protein DNK08_13095 [Stutzerimonas kirkiae]